MVEVYIKFDNNRNRFFAGEKLTGVVKILPVEEDIPLSNVVVSFHCLGEVKWVENPGTPYYLNGFVYYDKYSFLDETLQIPDAKSRILEKNKKAYIGFEFDIAKNKDLPSTMISTHGFIQYFVKAAIRTNKEIKKTIKEIIVESPIEENLMITVGSTAEKNVLLHSGHVSMHASISRKGFAPGELIDVHIAVNNKSSAKLTPRIALFQSQNYLCGNRRKTIETSLTNEPVMGKEVGGHKETVQVLNVKIPEDESLSIRSSMITVKYFVHVTLDIPHSFDLHINLPITLTSKMVIDSFHSELNHFPTLNTSEQTPPNHTDYSPTVPN